MTKTTLLMKAKMMAITPDGKILQMTVDEYKQLYGVSEQYKINKLKTLPSCLSIWLGFPNIC